MKKICNYLIMLMSLTQVSYSQTVTTYSTLSTGYNRIYGYVIPPPSDWSPTPFLDPNWYFYKRQDLSYSPPDFDPVPGTIAIYDVKAFVIKAQASMLTDLAADYINYDSTYNTTNAYYITYRTSFTLSAFHNTNKRYSLVLKMRADSLVYDVRLNGSVIVADTMLYKDSLGSIVGRAYSGDYARFTVPYCDSHFKAGQNYLEITCADVDSTRSAMAAEVILYQQVVAENELCPGASLIIPCEDCIGSFSPIPGKKYLISGWVKEGGAAQSKTSYTYPSLTVKYPSLADSSGPFFGNGDIIDGWQRIEGEFVIPPLATDLNIKLQCNTGDCYFDDIRVFPFDGSMKSYVYDPVTMRLAAELDERNYATLYEYDEEGKLVRVKKETQKGIMTIKENRNNTKKQ